MKEIFCFDFIEVIWGLCSLYWRSCSAVFPSGSRPLPSAFCSSCCLCTLLPDNSRRSPSQQLTRHHGTEDYTNASPTLHPNYTPFPLFFNSTDAKTQSLLNGLALLSLTFDAAFILHSRWCCLSLQSNTENRSHALCLYYKCAAEV